MDWRSHAAIGAILVILVFWAAGLHDLLVLALGAGFGALSALVPDLDHDLSKGRKLLDLAFVGFAILTAYLGECHGSACLPSASRFIPMAIIVFAMLGCYFVLFRFFKPRHRGITHTLVVCFGFGVLVYVSAGWVLALAGLAGYLSHLIADNEIKLL